MNLYLFSVMLLHALCQEKCVRIGEEIGYWSGKRDKCVCGYVVTLDEDEGIPFNLRWNYRPPVVVPQEEQFSFLKGSY